MPTTHTQLITVYKTDRGIYSNYELVVKESNHAENDEELTYDLRSYTEFIEYASANKGLDDPGVFMDTAEMDMESLILRRYGQRQQKVPGE